MPGNIWQGYVPSPYDSDEVLVKIDHQINDAHRLSGNYFLTTGYQHGARRAPATCRGPASSSTGGSTTSISATPGSSAPTGSTRRWFSFNRNFGGRLNLPAVSLTDLGSSAVIQGAPSLPQITVSGFFTLTNAIGGPNAGGDFYSGRDVFSWTTGAPRAQDWAASSRTTRPIQDTLLNNYGVLTFNNSVTQERAGRLPDRHSQRGDAGRAGHRPLEQLVRRGVPAGRLPPQRAHDAEPRPAVGRADARHRSAQPVHDLRARPEIHRQAGRAGRTAVLRRPGRRARRDPDAPGTTCRRASASSGIRSATARPRSAPPAGMFYGSISGNEWNTMTNFQPWSHAADVHQHQSEDERDRRAATAPRSAIPYNAFVGGAPFPYNGSFANGGGIFGVSQDFEWAHAYQTNVGIQRQIGRSLSVGAAYVGTFNREPAVRARRELPGASRRPRPAPARTSCRAGPTRRSARCCCSTRTRRRPTTACRSRSRLRPWHHVSFNGFYTLSKTMTSVQLQNNTTQGLAQNYSNLAEDYGRADTDQRHVFNMSVNWEIDYYRGGNAVAAPRAQRLEPCADHQAAQRPAVHRHQRQRRRQPRRQHERSRAARRRSAHRRPDGGHVVQHRRVRPEQGRHRRRDRRQLGRATCSTVPASASSISRSRATSSCRGGRKLTFRAEGTNVFNMVNLGQPGSAVPSGATSTTFGVIRTANADAPAAVRIAPDVLTRRFYRGSTRFDKVLQGSSRSQRMLLRGDECGRTATSGNVASSFASNVTRGLRWRTASSTNSVS